jgi:hypothetical protein
VPVLYGSGRGTFIGKSVIWGTGQLTIGSRFHRYKDYISISIGQGNYLVEGGGGKFAKASGGGTITLTLQKDYTFSASLSGTLRF